MSNNQPQPAKKTNNPFDIFIIGARKGLNITLNNLVPNILMAYAVAEVLRILGVMKMVGEIFGPLMFVFGLPGEAVTVVLTAWLSSSASVGLAANMAANGILDARHVTILMPCFFLLGAQLQYMGRLLGVADVPKRYWPLLMSASLL
ncbi:MAG: YjiG family protein, partial [Phascolarctobacterium sp.]|nr:YjiG family protein [Phascolarctobacterium sp.]